VAVARIGPDKNCAQQEREARRYGTPRRHMNRSPQWIRKTVHTITARRIPWKPPMGFCGARAVAHAAWFIERLRGDWRFPCRLCRIRVIGAVLAASRLPPVCPQLRTSRRTVPTAEIVAHHVHRMTSLPADGCGRGSRTSRRHAKSMQMSDASAIGSRNDCPSGKISEPPVVTNARAF
jgi:hypothetical protein